PWLQILSPLSGTVTSPVLGGALVPVQLRVDCNQFPDLPDPMLGMPVIVRADGGMMPVLVALLPVKAGFTSPPQFINGSLGGFGGNYNELIFNKAAIYPAPNTTPTPVTTAIPTATAIPTSTPTPGPNVGVAVVPMDARRLQVTISGRPEGCTPSNQLQ